MFKILRPVLILYPNYNFVFGYVPLYLTLDIDEIYYSTVMHV